MAHSPLTVAARASVPPFYVMDVVEAANARQRAKGDVVSLAAGQPSAPAAAPVLEAAEKALRGNKLGYTEQLGIPELREAIAGHYDRKYSVRVSPQDVVVTTGSSGGFLLSFLSAFDPGDRVALARPGYPAYRNILTALGCEVVEMDTFQPTVELLDTLGPIKGVVIASPANPTGTVVAGPELAAIAGWCAERGVQLISDEIYHGIDYGIEPASAWQYSREALVVNSFSKYFAMTGWRLGWLLVPHRLHRAVECLIGNFNICAPAIAQHAAVAAFTDESYAELDGHVESYRANRDTLLAGLKQLKIDRLAPADGAFYVYADIGHLTHDAMSWCQRLLAGTGLAIVPGIDFDPEHGSRFIRLSFAGAHHEIEEALRRLGGWVTP
ncbi:aminotransferase class I/II-fold pyridoxal phosphate-dependent enzyme [Kibdelosporangium phytohabitans]|uniref:Aminotransferase n=1 Tax=Kibdelosporangium phytohabitans TaxID=860235 RepID=A0A0N9ICV5_9PSEU|nr:aminotransferase class I/II-fold pyridoxal phosphate-dependent enzyme [Kibdelosporangium phytohabitans]ALG14243.1 aspartate aminotransferase [Kibdelosporangium phytohabitans]MBE1466755.1 aspartate/methionine/tyrosine aminotransferase [Kibdelosporangium phytohabitans]